MDPSFCVDEGVLLGRPLKALLVSWSGLRHWSSASLSLSLDFLHSLQSLFFFLSFHFFLFLS